MDPKGTQDPAMAAQAQAPIQSEIVMDDDEIDLLDLAETVAERFWLLILGPLAVGLTALGISFLITPTFTAKTMLLPPQQQQGAAAALMQSLGALGGLAGAAAGIKNPNDQIVSLLKSRTISDQLIDKFDLMTVFKAKLRQEARKTLESRVRISSGKDGLISIEVDDSDPKRAAAIAQAYIESLSQLMGTLALTEAQQRRVFFERQLKDAREQMTRAEIALKSGGVEGSVLKVSPEAAVGAVAKLQAEVTAQEIKLAAMRGYLTESSPQFQQGLVELKALRAQLAKLESSQQTRTQTEGASDYINRYRDFKYYETLFELFAKQFEIARVDESREGTLIQIVDPPEVPEWKSKPKRALIAVIATLASGFALLLYVFVVKAIRSASQDPDRAARLNRIRDLVLRRKTARA